MTILADLRSPDLEEKYIKLRLENVRLETLLENAESYIHDFLHIHAPEISKIYKREELTDEFLEMDENLRRRCGAIDLEILTEEEKFSEDKNLNKTGGN